MVTDMQFNVLSEEKMRQVQFRAHHMYQQLKEEEQWNMLCGHGSANNAVATAPVKLNAAVQVKPVKCLPKYVPVSKAFAQKKEEKAPNEMPQMKRNVSVEPSTKDLKVIFEKLENLQINILELKSNQCEIIRQRCIDEQQAVPSITYPEQPSENIYRSELVHQTLASILAKNRENEISKMKNTVPKGVGYLLPYCLREERMLARRALGRSKVTRPTAKIENMKSMVDNKKQVQFYAGKATPHGKTTTKPKSMGEVQKPTKTLDPVLKVRPYLFHDVAKSPKGPSAKKLTTYQGTNADNEVMPHAEETKWKNIDSITLLEQRMKEIEQVEIAVRRRLNSLKAGSLGERKQSETCSSQQRDKKSSPLLENMKKLEHLNLDNTHGKITVTTEDNKASEEMTSGATGIVQLQPVTTTDEIIDETVNTHRLDITIEPSVLKRIHHYRKSYNRYLKRTAHQKGGNFNPWMVVEQMSDLIVDDCIEEVAQELNKIPSSFIIDVYNQEFAQSLL